MTTVTDTKVSERGVEHQSSTLGDTKVHPNRRKGSEARRPGEDEGRRQGRVDRYRFKPTRESKNQQRGDQKKKNLDEFFFNDTCCFDGGKRNVPTLCLLFPTFTFSFFHPHYSHLPQDPWPWVDLVSPSCVELWCSTHRSLTLASVTSFIDRDRLNSTCNP